MPIKVDSVEILKKYFSKVVGRVSHHAPNVNEVVYALVGIIILKMDENSSIEVWGTNDDATGNILWITIAGKGYAFRYEHSNETIEIRDGSHKGPLLLSIDNSTTVASILNAL